MAIYYRNQLYKGKYIDIRSYERDDALKRKQDVLLILQDSKTNEIIGKMTLTVAQLKKKRLIKEQIRVPSKVYLGQYYNLLSYEWRPDKILSKEEELKKYLI